MKKNSWKPPSLSTTGGMLAPESIGITFCTRLGEHTGVDLGDDMDSPLIRKIKAHIRRYRKL